MWIAPGRTTEQKNPLGPSVLEPSILKGAVTYLETLSVHGQGEDVAQWSTFKFHCNENEDDQSQTHTNPQPPTVAERLLFLVAPRILAGQFHPV